MTNVNVFKRFTFLGFFAFAVGAWYPASAQEIPSPGAGWPVYDVAAARDAASLKDRLKDIILGNQTGTNTSIGTDVGGQSIGSGITYRSLTGYFESVWWPKFVATNQVIAKQNAGAASLGMASDARLADADNQVDYKSGVQQNDWAIQDSMVGAEDVLCGPASLGQSQTVIDMLSRQYTQQVDQQNVIRRSGAPGGSPTVAEGPNKYNYEAVLDTNSAGTCVATGNNGANSSWCTGGDDLKAGFHTMATTILGQTAAVGDATQRNNFKYINMFMERLFPDFFSPVRPELLKSMTSDTAEVLNKQDAYKAALSVFNYPFNKMIGEINPFQNISSATFLRKALTRIGLDASLMKNYVGDGGGMTKAAADRILYLDYMRDPATLMESATWHADNVLRMITVTNMNQVTLLYEIREEIKNTNALLGAMGSMLTRDMYNDLQAKSSALSSK